MTKLASQDFTKALFTLLKETFEGPPEAGGNTYLETGGGLFPTLDAITADVASRDPAPGARSIAAHCFHLDYYVRVVHNSLAGREEQVDWASSWRVQNVGPAEWEALKARLRSGYDELRNFLDSLPAWAGDSVCDSMAIVAHTAYHLGAIRQIRRSLGG
jgi:hypothetical protein